MFTGIIEDLGKIVKYDGSKLKVETSLDGIKQGDSVAVNGICLTATEIFKNSTAFSITFDCSQETARLTDLSNVKPGDRVNLERALKFGDRVGGHFLSGHVEAAGSIKTMESSGNSVMLTISAPASFMRYVVSKGSVGVDGISLTVADAGKDSFSAAIIPHTFNNTVLRFKKSGAGVNLESDILARYADKFSGAGEKTGISLEMLKENGF
jgi:riboflavin synthase